MLEAGRKRRRAGGRIALLALLLAPLVVGAAAWFALTEERRSDATRALPLARGASAPAAGRAAGPGAPAPEIRLAAADAFHLRLRQPPRAALLFELESGEVLWRHRPLERLPVASLTKIMSALLVTERTAPAERVKITRAALRYQGSGIGVLRPGKRVWLEMLMHGLLLLSGNDAAIALAVHVAGSERRFVRLMNRRARQLGLNCTRFVDSNGLSPGNRSCPRDLAVLTRLAMANLRIRRIVRRPEATFRFPVPGGRVVFLGHNPLIRAGYRGAIGLKTGYTRVAGRCFVGVARRRGRTLGVVLLDSPDPGRQAARLLNAGFRAG